MGPASTSFPHASAWKIEGKPLDEVAVRDITRIIAQRSACPPGCIAAWEDRLGKVPWDLIARRFTDAFLTSVDYASYFQNIIHRSLFVNNINPDADSSACRYCRAQVETIAHLGDCTELNKVWKLYTALTQQEMNTPQARLLGATASGVLGPTASALHILVWKYIILGIMEGASRPTAASIWRSALRRYCERALAIQHVAR